jgi:glutaredoxin-dependent peroxiredoxin
MPIAVGTKAPDFTLKTWAGEGLKDVGLSDVSGELHRYSGLGARVYAARVDRPFAQAACAK